MGLIWKIFYHQFVKPGSKISFCASFQFTPILWTNWKVKGFKYCRAHSCATRKKLASVQIAEKLVHQLLSNFSEIFSVFLRILISILMTKLASISRLARLSRLSRERGVAIRALCRRKQPWRPLLLPFEAKPGNWKQVINPTFQQGKTNLNTLSKPLANLFGKSLNILNILGCLES